MSRVPLVLVAALAAAVLAGCSSGGSSGGADSSAGAADSSVSGTTGGGGDLAYPSGWPADLPKVEGTIAYEEVIGPTIAFGVQEPDEATAKSAMEAYAAQVKAAGWSVTTPEFAVGDGGSTSLTSPDGSQELEVGYFASHLGAYTGPGFGVSLHPKG